MWQSRSRRWTEAGVVFQDDLRSVLTASPLATRNTNNADTASKKVMTTRVSPTQRKAVELRPHQENHEGAGSDERTCTSLPVRGWTPQATRGAGVSFTSLFGSRLESGHEKLR